ncbi:DNA polymerase IV [Enorma phocaeensis]|uniref:DNA polymerase IV n=1 Tax=Enorma phocaeensis TaxID=1871019 RepID=A0ABT7V662_9ACTN|nr:DNA polymerase IV [Enorma phocaeensis]MBM6952255.1 DNA polymerase IV [Enorma phocaeensis]MDM8273984.1 DNA polymerase IV [Enorma phocaeensis]
MNTGEHTYDILGPWEGPAVGLMDLDAFFASVEQLDHPSWRGKPVIVGGSPEARGVVSTASYEARPYGVHSAMPSAQAARLCPDAIWTRGHFDRYREVSARVMAVVEDETPYLERVSIDEAFFDISPGRYSKEHPITIARRIQERVSAIGVTCSIGLGCNKTVAKIASERDKPRGLTVVMPGTEASFLAPLPVRAMSGIGSSAERALGKVGIHTLGQLAAASISRLSPIFGVNAEAMRQRAAGLERSAVRPVDAPEDVKSVSNERTFAHDLTERSDVDAALALLGESVGRRLRKRGLAGRTVTVKVKYSYGSGRTIQRKLPHPTDDEHVFVRVGRELLDELWGPGTHIRLLGIGVSDFDLDGGIQTDLFCEVDERGAMASERRGLSVAVDHVRERFGTSSVTFGRATRFSDEVVRSDKQR